MATAHEAGVSPRHLSFVETGRSNPSRSTLSRVASALDLSLRDHNTLMLAAGYAPLHPSNPWTAPEFAGLRRSLAEMVRAHAPFPAMVIDIKGDILLPNSALLTLIGDVADEQHPLNTYRLVLERGGIAERILNRDAWQTRLAAQLIRRAAEADDPTLTAMADAVAAQPRIVSSDEGSTPVPVLPLRMTYGDDVVTLASVRAYLTEPRDVVASELCLETFIPLDDSTRETLSKIADTP